MAIHGSDTSGQALDGGNRMTNGEALIRFLELNTVLGWVKAYSIVAIVTAVEFGYTFYLTCKVVEEEEEKVRDSGIVLKCVFLLVSTIAFVCVVIVGAAVWPVWVWDRMNKRHQSKRGDYK